jgi:hypothetical protein
MSQHRKNEKEKDDTMDNRKTVSFGSIQVRSFNRILGDHPEVQFGPPLSLSWEFVDLEAQTLDKYESTRPSKKRNLRLSSLTRRNLLENVFDVPSNELIAAEKAAKKIQRQRERSNKQGRVPAVVESALLSVNRKIQRTFLSRDCFEAFAAIDSTYNLQHI